MPRLLYVNYCIGVSAILRARSRIRLQAARSRRSTPATGERLPPLARSDRVRELASFFAREGRGAAAAGQNTTTFQQDGDENRDKGVWLSVWVDDVDGMHKQCVAAGLEITFPPTDVPWNVREMHLRHPDGHVFRVGRGFE